MMVLLAEMMMLVMVIVMISPLHTQSPQLSGFEYNNLNDLRQYDLKFIHTECKSVVPDINANTLHYRKIARQVTEDMQDVPIALYSTYWNIAFYLAYLQYKVTPLGGKVLEISGHSMLTKYFKKRNTKFTHTSYPEVDVTRLDQSFRGNTFDVVIMDRVLEHVSNPMLAISQCYHVLNPGGKLLVISFSNHPYHWGPWDFNRFTTDTLKVLVSPFSSIDLCGSYRSTKMMKFLATNYTSASIRLANHTYLQDIILEAPAVKSISMPDYGIYRGGSKPSNRTWTDTEQYERTSSGDPKYGEFVFTSWIIASKHDQRRSIRMSNKMFNAPIHQQNVFDLRRFDLRYIYHNKCIYHIPDMHEKTLLYQKHPMIVRQVNNDMKDVHVTRYSTYWNIAYYLLYMHHHVSPLGGKVLEISGHSLLSKYFMKNNTEFVRPSYPEVDVTRLHEVYQPHSFDIVILDQVLEHVANPMLAVSECHYVLKPGGKLVVISPGNYPYHWGPWDFNRFTTDTLKVLASPFSSIDLCGSYRSTKMMQFLTKNYPRVYKNPANDKRAEEIALEAPSLISINQTYNSDGVNIDVVEEEEEEEQLTSAAVEGEGGVMSHQQKKERHHHHHHHRGSGNRGGVMMMPSSGDAKYGEFVFASWMIVSK